MKKVIYYFVSSMLVLSAFAITPVAHADTDYDRTNDTLGVILGTATATFTSDNNFADLTCPEGFENLVMVVEGNFNNYETGPVDVSTTNEISVVIDPSLQSEPSDAIYAIYVRCTSDGSERYTPQVGGNDLIDFENANGPIPLFTVIGL